MLYLYGMCVGVCERGRDTDRDPASPKISAIFVPHLGII